VVVRRWRDSLKVHPTANHKSVLGDLEILTGGTVFTDELDIKLERATNYLLGSTGSIAITKDDVIVFNDDGSKNADSEHYRG
jgi:chaperonin GroEL